MGASDREPWIKLRVGFPGSDKIGRLPDDSARWGWVRVLVEAKLQRRLGVFGSVAHLEDLLGRRAGYVPAYLGVGLLHELPDACERCRGQYADVEPGAVIVHDFRREQRDPTAADRQERHRSTPDAPVTPQSRSSHGAVTASSRKGHGESNAEVTPDSRARRKTVTGTGTEKGRSSSTGPARPHGDGERPITKDRPVLLTQEEAARQREAWASFSEAAWAPFVEAWRERFPDPPVGSVEDDPDTTLRSRLWAIADVRPRSLGQWVREAPGRQATEVLAHVFREFARVRAEVSDDDARWEGGEG
jgi:hypothetical protein